MFVGDLLRVITKGGEDERARPKFKLHEIEKDLNKSILSRKRENLMETSGGGTCRIFGNKSLKPDIRTTDSNPVANNGNDTST